MAFEGWLPVLRAGPSSPDLLSQLRVRCCHVRGSRRLLSQPTGPRRWPVSWSDGQMPGMWNKEPRGIHPRQQQANPRRGSWRSVRL